MKYYALVAGGFLLGSLFWCGLPWLRSLSIRFFCFFFDPPFRRGDSIRVGSYRGRVEEIGWRFVRLRAFPGEEIFVPHALFASGIPFAVEPRESAARRVEMRFKIPQGVSAGRAREAAEQAVAVSPYLAVDLPFEVLLEARGGEIVVCVRAGVPDEALRSRFETSVLEGFEACLDEAPGITRDRAT